MYVVRGAVTIPQASHACMVRAAFSAQRHTQNDMVFPGAVFERDRMAGLKVLEAVFPAL